MFTAESIKLLAKPAQRQTRTHCHVGTSDELGPHSADDNDRSALLPLPPGDDPDVSCRGKIDPASAGLSNVPQIAWNRIRRNL